MPKRLSLLKRQRFEALTFQRSVSANVHVGKCGIGGGKKDAHQGIFPGSE